MAQVASRIGAFEAATAPFLRFFSESTWTQRRSDPATAAGIADFVVGNPHEMPLPAFVESLQRWSVPQNKDWYAYKMSEADSQAVIAKSLRERYSIPFEDADICLTNGGFAAIAVALNAVVNPGDEVIFITPPWFFYEALIVAAGGKPVRVKIDLQTFDLDLKAIEAAITSKTRAIIINSPNNPTGKIYPPETLNGLSDILTNASKRTGQTIYMLSDEAYSHIIYDHVAFNTPTAYYPNSFLLYTYGKTLLTPGQRLGYIALPPTMPERDQVRNAVFASQMMTGYAFPNALLQHALADLEHISIDIDHLERKRNHMVQALHDMGYEVHSPQGTFYLLPRSPLADDWAFIDVLAEFNVFCLPGSIVEMPGYFRISLTASDAMIDHGLPGFAAARERVLQSVAK